MATQPNSLDTTEPAISKPEVCDQQKDTHICAMPTPDQLPLYQSPRLSACAKRLIHAFTGKPLSLGGQALDLETRHRNREAFCTQLGLPVEFLKAPDQVHSDISKCYWETDLSACDALIVSEPNRPAMVLVADCVPIILYDPVAHVAAVIHAGWRGTAQAITAKTAKRLIESFACSKDNLIAAIGPCIGGCCYEVSDDVVQALRDTVPSTSFSHWHQLNGRGNPQVDLKTVNRLQLEALGIEQIDVLPNCTQCESETFFSHRRGEGGRQGVVVMLKAL